MTFFHINAFHKCGILSSYTLNTPYLHKTYTDIKIYMDILCNFSELLLWSHCSMHSCVATPVFHKLILYVPPSRTTLQKVYGIPYRNEFKSWDEPITGCRGLRGSPL